MEIQYIPREDLAHAPDYADSGVFLPLSQLLALTSATTHTAAAAPAPVYCSAIEMKGKMAGETLALEARLTYEAPGAEWSTTKIDDGAIPWTSQSPDTLAPAPKNPQSPDSAFRIPREKARWAFGTALPTAFLARVGGATWLFAKGPGRDVLTLGARLPAPVKATQATVKLGRFDAPCRIALELSPEFSLTTSTLPVRVETSGESTSATTRLTLWPSGGRAGELKLRRQAPLAGPGGLRFTLARTARMRGAALEVADELTLEDRLRPGRALRLGLPAGLRLLRAELTGAARSRAALQVTSGALVLTPSAEAGEATLSAVFAAELRGGQARFENWGVPAGATQFATLALEGSETFTPAPVDPSPALRPTGGSRLARLFLCEGALPPLALDLVRRDPPLPPRVAASLRLERGEAHVSTTIALAGTHRRDLLFHTPPGWVVSDLALSAPALPADPQQRQQAQMQQAPLPRAALPCSIQQLGASTWSAAWDPEKADAAELRLTLHRAGAWGAPGTTSTLALPLVAFEGERPPEYSLMIGWPPDQFDVRAGTLKALAQLPGGGLALRAIGERPAGTLEIRGRSADVRATVVTALSIGEDQARVRALIDWQVSYAPASVFRFRLPAGTGGGVKITGEGIRESTLRAAPEGDEWTVTMLNGVSGAFPMTVEWPLAVKAGAPVEAPQLRPLGVTAQRGFIVLESSETLLLRAEARRLAESDVSEVPPLPWARESRILGVWRYIEPPYTLRVTAEKFQPEPPLAGLVREAALTTTLAPEGMRLTQAEYSLMPMSDRQFFEVRLPEGARLWSALVGGAGVKPARRPEKDGSETLLVPLPAVTGHAGDFKITVLYQETGQPLARLSRLELGGPTLADPVSRTTWRLNLPPGFEYLAYGGPMVNQATVRVPLATFLRTATYPAHLVLDERTSTFWIAILSVLAALIFAAVRHRLKHPRPPRLPQAAPAPLFPEPAVAAEGEAEAAPQPPPPMPERFPIPDDDRLFGKKPQGPGCGGLLLKLLVIGAIVFVLAMIAVPNFLEAQTRSKIARTRNDMRSITLALESYYIDQNTYPNDANVLYQGPIKYLPNWYTDPYAETPNTPLHYLNGRDAVRAAKASGFLPPDAPENAPYFYLLYSIGPDQHDDGGTICYDPTNGTNSAGDLIRVKDGAVPQYAPQQTFRKLSEDEWFKNGGAVPAAPAASAPPQSQATLTPGADHPARGTVNRREILNGQTREQTILAPGDYNPAHGAFSRGDISNGQTGDALANQPASGPAAAGKPAGQAADQSKGIAARGRAGALGLERGVGGVNINGDQNPPAKEEMKELDIKLPKPMFTGAPKDISSPNQERQESAKSQAAPQKWSYDQVSPEYTNLDKENAAPEERLRRQKAVMGKRSGSQPAGNESRPGDQPSPIVGGRVGEAQSNKFNVYTDAFDLNQLADEDANAHGAIAGGGGFGGGRARGYASGYAYARREAGLLSLAIELPEGGLQRTFESLGGKARIDIRLLEHDRFLRWRFIVWMAAFLALSSLWLASPRAWRWAFVLGLAFTLLVPLVAPGAGVVFFNTALQGILFSVVTPLAAWLLRLFHARLGVALLLVLALSGAGRAQAQALAAPAPAKILIPYDTAQPDWGGDPLAFMSRAEFARLWEAAHPEALKPPSAAPALTGLTLSGAFDPQTSAMGGLLAVYAVNPTDLPTSLPLRLGNLTLTEAGKSDPPGATIDVQGGGLFLRLAPHWRGRAEARYVLACPSEGSTGRLLLDLPEAATGQWNFVIPWRGAQPQGPGAAGCVAQAAAGGTELLGALRPGRLDLGWQAGAAAAATSGAAEGWRCDIQHTIQWSTLAAAGWFARLQLSGAGGLPAEVRLPLDPGVRIDSATGEALRATRIEGGELILTLAPARAAEIRLTGFIPPPAKGAWTIPAVRLPRGVAGRVTASVEMHDSLEILSIDPKGLERRPSPAAPKGYAMRAFEAAAPDWALRLELARPAPSFAAETRELFMLDAGLLHQAARVILTPRAGALSQLRLRLAPGARARVVNPGASLVAWTQDRRDLLLTFEPPVREAVRLDLAAVADVATSAGLLTLTPLEVAGAAETRRSAAMLIAPDFELQEVEMAGATPRVCNANDDGVLLETMLAAGDGPVKGKRYPDNQEGRVSALLGEQARPETSLRGWTLATGAPLRLRLAPIPATALVKVYNCVTLADGIQTLEGVITAEPRRGRLRQVEAVLRLGEPDPTAAQRLQATGDNVRQLRAEPLDRQTLRVTAELNAPADRPVSIGFHYDQPSGEGGAQPLRASVLTPAGESGSRAFLLLRRQIEGELAPADLAGARAAAPGEIAWPNVPLFKALPSDRAFELPARTAAGPSFTLQRHTRDETLSAFVDTMRHRSIVSPDGLERNELEIVVQNQSLQFLKVALPYPRHRVTIYEVQVASRVVKASCAATTSGDATLLMIPLIRTGLLEPELTVRVAYAVSGGAAFAAHGTRRQRMPEVLGGVPVAQSSMVLMLPSDYEYSGFTGSMTRVELVDLDVDETLRKAKQIEKLSESVLSAKGEMQQAALGRLNAYQAEVTGKVKAAKQTQEAYTRNFGSNRGQIADLSEIARQDRLAGERASNLKQAEAAEQNLASNTIRLNQIVQRDLGSNQAAQNQAATPMPVFKVTPPAPPVVFPRAGDVLAFRKLGGTGDVTLDYAARKTGEHRRDLMLALALVALAALLVTQSHRLFATWRRTAAVAAAACVAAIFAGAALDLAIPALAAAVLVIAFAKR